MKYERFVQMHYQWWWKNKYTATTIYMYGLD